MLDGLVRGIRYIPLVAVFGTIACHPSAPPPREAGERNLAPTELLAGARVEDVEHADCPTLRLVRRGGDPAGAVAMAAFPDGGTRAALVLSALLEVRLQQAGFSDVVVSPHALGVVVAGEASDPGDGARLLQAMRSAIRVKVRDEVAVRERAVDLLGHLHGRLGDPSAVGACLGSLGAEGRDALNSTKRVTQEEVEQIRRNVAVAQRVGFAAIGEGEFLETVASAHEVTWEDGALLVETWPEVDEVNVLAGAGSNEIRVAVRLRDQASALATARRLQQRRHLVHSRLHGIEPAVRLTEVAATLRPVGACVAVTAMATEGALPLEQAATLAAALREEISLAASRGSTGQEATLALLAPSSALEAAGLAAWSAVSGEADDAATLTVVEYRRPTGSKPTQSDFRSAVKQVAGAWRERALTSSSRFESGQTEAWLLLASPCGTRGESAADAGLKALMVQSIAADFSGREQAVIEPWVTEDAVGILVHGSALAGESPEQHAERLGRVAGAALAGPALDGRDVATIRAAQLERLGNDPGRDEAIRILSGGVASWVQTEGVERSVAVLSTADVERARSELARAPLQLAFLGNSSRQQAKTVDEAVSRWLAPLRTGGPACAVRDPKPPAAGMWSLETVEPKVEAGVHIVVVAPAARELGRATEYLLNRPGGYLEMALSGVDGEARAWATWLGGPDIGGMLIEVRAEPAKLDRTVEQVRGVLDELAAGGMPDAHGAQAASKARELHQHAMRSPRGRVVDLWLRAAARKAPESAASKQPDDQPQVTVDGLRSFHRSFSAAEHRLVRVRVRR